MTRGARLALAAVLAASAAGCRQTPEAKAAQARAAEAVRKRDLARRIAIADANPGKVVPLAMWLMPPELHEISGLTLTSRGTILTHDDNVGRVYEIDPTTGILLKAFSLAGNPKEDFEAITVAGNDIYLLSSNGKLFGFREGADGTQVPFTVYDTHLGKECEFESVVYEADSSRLVMACKRILKKDEPKGVLLYRIPLPLGSRATITPLRIPIQEVEGSNHWKNFRPSDMTIDPNTHNYVLIASREKGLVVLTPEGDVVRTESLPGDHRQPEGIAITRDSILMLSDEANVKPAAITLYRWHP